MAVGGAHAYAPLPHDDPFLAPTDSIGTCTDMSAAADTVMAVTTIRFEANTANTAAAAFVEGFAVDMQVHIDAVASQLGLATPDELNLILTDDFVVEVTRRSPDVAATPEGFTTLRMGGGVAAKNLPVADNPNAATVVLNEPVIDYADTANGGQVLGAFVVVHELLHPPLNWTRERSGALNSVTFPSHTPSEVARSIVRGACDEYRADCLASTMVAIATRNEEQQVALAGWLAEQHAASLADAFTVSVHPGWADTVDRYRDCEIPLMDMWGTIVEQTDQLFTLLAHADAATTSAERPRCLTGAVAAHAAVALYVQDAWEPVISLLEEQPLVTGVDEFRDLELELLDVGEEALLAMWAKLGLTFTDLPDRGFYIHVNEPLR